MRVAKWRLAPPLTIPAPIREDDNEDGGQAVSHDDVTPRRWLCAAAIRIIEVSGSEPLSRSGPEA